MRRILITDSFHEEVESFCNSLFNSITDPRFLAPINGLRGFRVNNFSVGLGSSQKRKYISKIIELYSELKLAKPSQFDYYIQIFENIIPTNQLSKDFTDEIIGALRYDRLRETEYPGFIKNYKIKACVYCNAIITVVIDIDDSNKANIKRKNNFELDHFYPSSKYPYLATTFYNLHPTCGNCNRAKNSEKVNFGLYTEKDDDIDVFSFNLSEESIVNYWNYMDIKEVSLNFVSVKGDKDLVENHNKYFKVDKIYQEQMDIVEELLQKSMAYNKASREGLSEAFKSIFPDETVIKRLIIGNYTQQEEIHKRPMAKFTQDIADQLGLIKIKK